MFRVPTVNSELMVGSRIHTMEVKLTYELDGEIGAVAIVNDVYEIARDEARTLIPEGTTVLNIRVDRET